MKRKEVTTVIEGLLECLEPVNWDEVPQSCGACGTPTASCDTNCVERANAAIYDQRYKAGKALVEKIKELPQPLTPGTVLSNEAIDRLLLYTTSCPECQQEFDDPPPNKCNTPLHKQIYESFSTHPV